MMKCVCGKVIEVLKSNAGYYLGAVEESEFCPGYFEPYCRVSGYYRTREEAQKALDTRGFAERHCMENSFCAEQEGAESCFETGE